MWITQWTSVFSEHSLNHLRISTFLLKLISEELPVKFRIQLLCVFAYWLQNQGYKSNARSASEACSVFRIQRNRSSKEMTRKQLNKLTYFTFEILLKPFGVLWADMTVPPPWVLALGIGRWCRCHYGNKLNIRGCSMISQAEKDDINKNQSQSNTSQLLAKQIPSDC